jgi:multiple sugar transport system substrate-binding protein
MEEYKMLKRIIAVISAVLMAASFAACKGGGAANGNNSIQGKTYTQQSFDGSQVQGGLNPVIDSLGNLMTASQESGKPAVVTTWDANGKKKGSLTTDVTDAVSMLALGPKDAVYILASDQNRNQVVHVLDASGKTVKTIPITGMQPAGMMQQTTVGPASSNQNAVPSGNNKAVPAGSAPTIVIGMQVAPDGGVIVSALNAGVKEFDPSGKEVRAYGQGGGLANYIAVNEKNQLLIYSMVNGSPMLHTVDISSGKQLSSLDVPAMPSIQLLFYDKSGKRLLYMTGSDIQKLSADGKTGAVLATFSDFSLIDGFRQLMGFAVDKSGTIYLTATNSSSPEGTTGGGQAAQPGSGPSLNGSGGNDNPVGMRMGSGINEIIRLGLVDASTLKAKKTITVAAINGSQVLNQVISAFQKANPDYKINLKVYNTQAVGMQAFVGPGMKMVTKQGGAGSQDLSSYIQALNTDLMSGNGADIIVLDDLPWYKYVDKGLLADIGQLMSDKQFDTSPYYTNIFDGCKTGGKLYGIPASFTYTLLAGKAAYMPDSATPTLPEFMAKAKALPQGVSPFGNQDASQIFEQYIQYCYPQLVDTVNHKAHFDTPEFIQAMKDFKGLIGENTSSNTNQDAKAEQLNGNVAYNAVTMSNPIDLSMQRAILGSDMKTANLPTLAGSDTNLFSASLMLGINANSKNQDTAWEFIKTMLGEDVQGNQTEPNEGYPVLKSASQKKIDDMKTGSKLGTMRAVMRIGDKEIEAKPLTDADYQSILDTLPALNALQAADPNVLKILSEELPSFFTGQKTAETVASLIQNRVNTLLNE